MMPLLARLGRRRAENVALIEINGDLDEATAMRIVGRILAIDLRSTSFKAVLLHVSCGGGSLAAAQTIVDALDFLAIEGDLPFRCVVTDRALSAAAYVAASCSHVCAAPAALVGGFGSIFRRLDLSGTCRALGARYSPISSGTQKDALLPVGFGPGDDAVLQAVVDDHLDQFRVLLAQRRQLQPSALDLLSDGRVVTARKGLELGLVNSLGGVLTALRLLGEDLGIEKPVLRRIC